jgi:trk system potassium uptake protein TrkA
MKVIVSGLTPNGIAVASALSRHGADIVAIDRNPQNLSQAEDQLDAMFLEGHEGTQESLSKAHAEEADLVVCATMSDELNLFAAAQAGRLGAKRTIAIVRNAEYLEGAPGIARNIHGVDFVLGSILLTASETHRMAHALRVLGQTHLVDGRITVEEIPVDHNDPVAGKSVDHLGLPESVRLVALVRDGIWVPASARERLQAGDRAILVGRRGAILQAEKRFQPGGQQSMRRAFVVGGGRIGLHVCRAFISESVGVTLFDRDRDRCSLRANDLPEATILCGDGTDVGLLQQEGVGNADVVLACTQDDETNLVVSLLAERLGTPHSVTLVHRPRNLEIYRHLGLQSPVSRPVVMAEHVTRLAQQGDAIDVVEVADGMLLAIDLNVGEGSAFDGQTLENVGMPADAIPCFGLHETNVIPLVPSTRLVKGDRLVVLVSPKRRKSVEKLARGTGPRT